MVRITVAQPEPGVTSVRIDGRLDESGLPELQRAVGSGPARGRVVLVLEGLSGLDAPGLRYLTALRAEGAALQGASMYVARLLGEAQS